MLLGDGDLGAALAAHPVAVLAVFALAMAAAWAVLATLWPRWRRRAEGEPGDGRRLLVGLLLLVGLSWVWAAARAAANS